MCEYNACLLFLTNTGFYYFLCCCQESWADFRAQDSNLLVLWSYNCLCHVFWIAGLDFVLCFWCKYYLSELLCYWIDCIFDHRRLHASLLNWILTYMYICTQLYIPLEFLTSLWEMWTAAQGWGSPRKTEAGWDTIFLFPACTVSIYLFESFVLTVTVFKGVHLKQQFYPAPKQKSLKDLLSVFNWVVEIPAASDVWLWLYVCCSLLIIWNVFFTVFWQPLCGSRGICFREKGACG